MNSIMMRLQRTNETRFHAKSVDWVQKAANPICLQSEFFFPILAKLYKLII